MMLNHLLHLQLNLRAVQTLLRDVALHKGAVEAPGDPVVRVGVVRHAGDVLAGVVAVAFRDGVHVVAQRVHDAVLVGADAHDGAAFAVDAHGEFVRVEVRGGLVGGVDEFEAASAVGGSAG